MPQLKGYLVSNDQKTDLKFQQTTIGRLSSNLITINDPTISKNHAIINLTPSNQKFYLTDLSTVNGTFLNGTKLQPNKKYNIKHKDAIQFGKYIHLYHFYQCQPESEKKGKINLKDYCFELDSDEDLSLSKSINQVPKVTSAVKSQLNPQPVQQSRPAKAVKIPQLADYLELEASLLSSNPSVDVKNLKASKFAREKVNLVPNSNQFEQQELKKLRAEEQHRKNIYLQQQAQKMARQQKARALQQQKIRLQVQRHKQEEQMLRKQIQLQQKVREQQQKMSSQKRRIEEELLVRQQQRRQKQKRVEEQQQEKERRFVEQLRQEKQEELEQIRIQQEQLRTKNQLSMKEELQSRKKELEMEAQALASQYEQIYKQTIRKMKNDIEKQQAEIQEMERNIQRAKEEKTQYQLKINQLAQAVDYSQKQYDQVSGRNKAFILYASQLQNRLDKMKMQRAAVDAPKSTPKLRQDLTSSRKLLTMKRGQLRSLEEEISKIRLSLNMDKRMSHSDMLQTILANHEAIQRSKYVYFEYLREQKALKQMWEFNLEQNDHLQQQNQNIEKDNQNHKKELMGNLRDNASRLTQQRIHMLKCLHYLPEDKKRAAKLLIEQMVAMQEQIKTMTFDCQQAHDKINSLIINSERIKMDNQYLSTLLFGSDSTAHHFDNMKIQINDLIQRVGLDRDEGRVQKRLKMGEEVEGNQVKIYQSSKKLQALKSRWRQGLRTQKVMLADKNPIAFFGDLLTKKETELQQIQIKASQHERQFANISMEIDELQRKKGHLSDSLENFKRDELAKVRQDLM